ncbi:MAG: BrxE family protein [Desulfobacterales bacterium]|nr:MAG: BrxE family protein [Desulfobacterales bacterium]
MGIINLERLLKLRLTVARFGEMDCARWWNTQGILGKFGALALTRGFPKTHRFAQAKIAFSVAAHRLRRITIIDGLIFKQYDVSKYGRRTNMDLGNCNGADISCQLHL